MNRQAQAAVLFLTGGAILHAALTDLYLRYVKAGLQPLLLAAGVVLIATATATVWYEHRGAGTPTESPTEAEAPAGAEPPAEAEAPAGAEPPAGAEAVAEADAPAPAHTDTHLHTGAHPHTHHEPRISWLLVLPLLALVLVAPPALGSYSAMRTGTALQKQPWGFADLPAGDTVRLNLVDYAGRAAYDHGRSLDHRRIKIAGLLALDRDGSPYLVRMALNCCAADAQPVKIGLTGRIPPVLRPDTWLEATGTYTTKQTKDPLNDGIIPFLDVTDVKPVRAPRDPYDESWNG
ncbi:TIGR03943 family protein [Streptomyces sp. NBC_00878]|uniref:TIGR03943 family putative permease subunit n=1 Tax=Streptomyces sp. NBC_00878 TaxID=2975854 RepID=UPI00225BA436|nr:TIGR03943 family protein [Streptomyces sp. NBC_00878]MCX4907624.1 TIGR03943 family protein [Streptomyces sp. NBC_00878]